MTASRETSRNPWPTRRRNQYKTALHGLRALAEQRDLPRLVLSFGVITDFLAPAIPAGAALPRGYQWGTNGEGYPTFLWESQPLTPGIPDPLPPEETALRFARDLQSGLIVEVAEALGKPGTIWFSEDR